MLWSSSQIWSWLHPYPVCSILHKCCPSTVGFMTHDFHLLISWPCAQTNRCPTYHTNRKLSRSDRFRYGFRGGHIGWSQLKLASSVPPVWLVIHLLAVNYDIATIFCSCYHNTIAAACAKICSDIFIIWTRQKINLRLICMLLKQIVMGISNQ